MTYLFIALLHLTAIMSPGPDVTLIISNTLSKGKWQGFLTVLGVVTGIAIFLCATLLGFTQFVYQNTAIFKIIAFLSGFYLMYLGIKIIFPTYQQSTSSKKRILPKLHSSYLQGLITNLLNPKALLYFIGLFSRKEFHQDTFTIAIILWGVSLLGFSCIVSLISLPKISLIMQRFLSKIEMAFGILMVIFSFQILFFAFMMK